MILNKLGKSKEPISIENNCAKEDFFAIPKAISILECLKNNYGTEIKCMITCMN